MDSFGEIMSGRTNDELVKIVTVERDSFQPAAIEAAEKEIQKRNIELSSIVELKATFIELAAKQQQIEHDRVGALKRLVNFMVDTVAWLVLATLLGVLMNPLLNVWNQNILGYLILGMSFFGYYVFMETRYQKTFGKFLTNTKVIMKDGEKPERRDIVIRTAGRLIPFDQVSYLFTSNGIHDYVSNTVLTKD